MTITQRDQKHILVVEDEEKIIRLLTDQLELAGYHVHTEMKGQAALDYAAEQPPGLVVLDLRLPDISGYEVCRQLRGMYPSSMVPILIVTALDQPAAQLQGYTHGADAYLTKPFELRDLLDTVANLFGHVR